MRLSRILVLDMWKDANTELIEVNAGWLRQALGLVAEIDHETFVTSPRGLAPHKVGSHLRHVLEFYECFLAGVEIGRIDYDNRKRDEAISNNRYAAASKIRSIISRLEDVAAISGDSFVAVRVENAENDVFLRSSVGRELQALSSHTIHHFALIAVTLRVHGFEVDPAFGMSPSTLRYQAAQALAASTEAA